MLQPTLLKSIRFCFIDVRWLLTAFDFQILKTTTCTLSYKTLKILSTFCSLVWKIRENLKILFSKIWPDRTDSCNIMCIWVKSPGEFKNLDLSKVNEHRTSSSLLESLKLSCNEAPAGDKYVGQFHADRRHGHGVYFYSNGEIFDGQWAAGHQDGG